MAKAKHPLQAKREAAGLSRERAVIRLANLIGEDASITQTTLLHWETDSPHRALANPLAVVGLAQVYDCKVSALFPELAEQLPALRDLLFAASGWISEYVAA
jgi:transcriptional regulator with XRE-family HTH domain